MAQIPTGLVNHNKKVCSLYKRALRMLESYHFQRDEFRYDAVLLRQRFEKNRNIKDARLAKKLLLDGEEELFQMTHWDECKFPDSPGGVAYQRFFVPADGILDYWHTVEKARYPKYFAKREELKKEYAKLYYKLYGESEKSSEKSSESEK